MLLMKAKQVAEECKFRMSIYSSINFLSLQAPGQYGTSWCLTRFLDRWKVIQTLFKITRWTWWSGCASKWTYDEVIVEKRSWEIHLTRSVHFNEAQLIKLLYKLILSQQIHVFFSGCSKPTSRSINSKTKWELN